MQTLNYDRLCELLGRPGINCFLLTLRGSLTHLGKETSWSSHIGESFFVAELSAEEFGILDYGVHPMFLVYQDGKEVSALRGTPSLEMFNKVIAEVKNGGKRDQKRSAKG